MGKIGFIGFGNMGSIMLKALLNAGAIPESKVILITRTPQKLKEFAVKYRKVEIAGSLSELATKSDRVFICTGTKEVKPVLSELVRYLPENAHVITITGTIEIKCVESIFSGRITKIMPTQITEVGAGVTLVCHNNKALPEDREFISVDYQTELATKLRPKFSSISVDIYQMTTEEYAKLFAAGIVGVTLYQETYDRETYRKYHPAGPKADYDYRLSAPDSFGHAGMREIGIGALLGLSDWRLETLALAEHAHYLMKRYWQSRVSFSFPRLRPAKDVDRSQFELLSDKNLVQMILALRLCFADAGLTISTREPAYLRDHLVTLGITRMSAGSKTNPGGYSQTTGAVEQFEIDDSRTPTQIAAMLKQNGLEPVWKDWDSAFSIDD